MKDLCKMIMLENGTGTYTYLVGHWRDFGGSHQNFKVLDTKIADPDTPTDRMR